MKRIKYLSLFAAIALGSLFTVPEATAQNKLVEGSFPVIITPHNQTVSYLERTLCFQITANVPFTATSNSEWISVNQGTDGVVYVHLSTNPVSGKRQGSVTFANEEQGLSETLTITQTGNESFTDLPQDEFITPTGGSANTAQGTAPFTNSYDGNTATHWHSAWNPDFGLSESNPAVLIYNFDNAERIDYVNYITRQDGTANGYFGKVKIYAQCGDEEGYTLVSDLDWQQTFGTHRHDFDTPLTNVKSIKFEVFSGSGNYASCAEMQFGIDKRSSLFSIFKDSSFSELKEGVTQDDINAIDDDFVAPLAQALFDGTYDKNYRVADYICRISPQAFSDAMNAPGKYYDQNSGVTGINISKGKHAIAVSGLEEGQSIPLHIIAWFEGKCSGNFDGGNPQEYDYTITNGINIIDYPFAYDGLAYVCYYSDVNWELKPAIKVHFINGEVNGYLSLDKTNEEMHQMCADAPNICMDVVGNNVHSIWTSRGVKDYFPTQRSTGLYGNCVATDGTSLGYRQFIHVMDSLAIWEQDLLGLHKYNRTPNNYTGAYVNFTYYMFQGGRGVSFHVDQEPRVLSCKTLVYNDEDVIWGLSHEWGHQHQMLPYFCWSGLGEVSNNMNSYFNIMRMGYTNNRMTGTNDGTVDSKSQYANARNIFLNHDYSNVYADETDGAPASLVSTKRQLAYENASELVSTKAREFALSMKDNTTITQYAVDPTKAVSIHEVGVGETLCPFLFVYDYFVQNGVPDVAIDWYESLRQNDDENGSQVEKQGAVDKYELLASAMNGNKNNKYDKFLADYPTSCWNTEGYLVKGNHWYQNSAPFMMNWVRKLSRITKYNLLPYFERWGFFRQVAMRIGDYGNKWMIITPDMYNEFKNDMDALVESGEIQAMPDGMVEAISNVQAKLQNRPVFPN
ncbi:MAG: M60 family metallopeptidase [Alloprevotella sp.]